MTNFDTAEMQLYAGFDYQRPDCIIVHSMGEFVAGDKDMFAPDYLASIGISVHALITPSGVVIRCRDDKQGAYHAKGFNTNSLGVEFLVPGVHNYGTFLKAIKNQYLTDIQLQAGVALVNEWIHKWGITRVVRHSDISPGRKSDPGQGFPWDDFLKQVSV